MCKIVIWCNVRIWFRWLYSLFSSISDFTEVTRRIGPYTWGHHSQAVIARSGDVRTCLSDTECDDVSALSVSVQMHAGYDPLQIWPSNFPAFVSRWCCFSSCQRFARWNCFATSMLACKQKTWTTLRTRRPLRMFSKSRRVVQLCTGSLLPNLDLRNRFVCWLMRAAIQSRHCRCWSTPWASSPSSHQAPSTWWNLATTYQACY